MTAYVQLYLKFLGNSIGPCFRVWCFNDSGYSRRYSVPNQGTFPQNRILMLRLLFAITWKYWLYNKHYFILQSNGCSARARQIIPDPMLNLGVIIRNLNLGSHENVFKSYDQFFMPHKPVSTRTDFLKMQKYHLRLSFHLSQAETVLRI